MNFSDLFRPAYEVTGRQCSQLCLSVILSTRRVRCDHYIWCIWCHHRGILPSPLDIWPHRTGTPPPPLWMWDPTAHDPLAPAPWTLESTVQGPHGGSIWWQTGDLFELVHLMPPLPNPPPPVLKIRWLLQHIWLTSWRYAPHRNAFLLNTGIRTKRLNSFQFNICGSHNENGIFAEKKANSQRFNCKWFIRINNLSVLVNNKFSLTYMCDIKYL